MCGSDSQTTQTNTPTFDPAIRDKLLGLLNRGETAADTPYQGYTGPRNAGFSDNQNAAFSGIAGLAQNPNTGTQAAQSTISNALSGGAPQATAASFGPASMTAAQLDPNALQQVGTQSLAGADLSGYLNPYTQAVTQQNLTELQRNNDVINNRTRASAAAEGAFGGSRSAITEAENNRNEMQTAGNLVNTANAQNFGNAQQQFQTDQQRALDAAKSNQGASLQAGLANAGFQQQAGSANAGYQQQAGLANSGYQQQVGLQNPAYDLQYRNLGLSAAGLQGQLGLAGNQNALQNYTALAGVGAQQQGLGQQNLNTAYQDFLAQRSYPYQQAQFLSGIYTGNPLATPGTTVQQPGPSAASTVGGLGAAGLGLYGAYQGLSSLFDRGGSVRYASGGNVSHGLGAHAGHRFADGGEMPGDGAPPDMPMAAGPAPQGLAAAMPGAQPPMMPPGAPPQPQGLAAALPPRGAAPMPNAPALSPAPDGSGIALNVPKVAAMAQQAMQSGNPQQQRAAAMILAQLEGAMKGNALPPGGMLTIPPTSPLAAAVLDMAQPPRMPMAAQGIAAGLPPGTRPMGGPPRGLANRMPTFKRGGKIRRFDDGGEVDDIDDEDNAQDGSQDGDGTGAPDDGGDSEGGGEGGGGGGLAAYAPGDIQMAAAPAPDAQGLAVAASPDDAGSGQGQSLRARPASMGIASGLPPRTSLIAPPTQFERTMTALAPAAAFFNGLASSRSQNAANALGDAGKAAMSAVDQQRAQRLQEQERADRNAIRESVAQARQAQAALGQQKLEDATAQKALIENAINSLPPDQQRLARLNPKAWVEGQTKKIPVRSAQTAAGVILYDGEGNEIRNLGPAVDRSTRVSNVVHLPPQENETEKAIGQLGGKAIEEGRSQALAANTTLNLTGQMRDALKQGLQTGTGAGARMAIGNAATTFGVNPKAVDNFFNVPAGRQFEEASNQMVLAFVKGLGANPSNSDRDFIERTVPQLRDNPRALQSILDRIEDRSHNTIDRYQTILKDSPARGANPLLSEAKLLAARPTASAPSAAVTPVPPPQQVIPPPRAVPVVAPPGPSGRTVVVPLAPAGAPKGARQAKDGKWYAPDPTSPSGWGMVN